MITDKELEQDAAFHRAAMDAAHQRLTRIASTLAGPDETLHRVLLAELHEAHLRGYHLATEEYIARIERRWEEADSFSPSLR